jgi:hypothetical protein
MLPCHVHGGAFVLNVESGAICYQQVKVGSSNVTVHGSPITGDTGTCIPTRQDCNDTDGCTLADGDIVYLPTGSTVIQASTGDHTYGNPDDSTPAVVYVGENLPQMEGTPPPNCGGACPRP